MNTNRSDGYILASAIGVLITISLVAAALVGASGDSLKRVQHTESQAKEEAVLQSAFAVLVSQLTLDPRRRELAVDRDEISFRVLERTVHAHMRWEATKLDINQASPDATAQLLSDNHLSLRISDRVIAAARRARATNTPVRLLSDLGLNAGEEACVSTLLTVFGGVTDYSSDQTLQSVLIGQPAVGSRLSLDLVAADGNRTSLSTVVLFTGNDAQPVEVLDWRMGAGLESEEVCRDI